VAIVQYSTVHIYTQTVQRTTQNKYIEQHKNTKKSTKNAYNTKIHRTEQKNTYNSTKKYIELHKNT
jgi:hypothetical protein